MESDDQLLARIKAGDRAALEALYHRYFPAIWRFVFAQLRRDDQASRDVVSETFLAAIRALGRGNTSVASVGAWLTGIARHKLQDLHREAHRQNAAQPGPEAAHDPAETLHAADTHSQITQVMTQLDDLERTILEWKYLEDLSIHQIAQRLNRTDKAIEAALYRARNSFRTLYDRMQQTNA